MAQTTPCNLNNSVEWAGADATARSRLRSWKRKSGLATDVDAAPRGTMATHNIVKTDAITTVAFLVMGLAITTVIAQVTLLVQPSDSII